MINYLALEPLLKARIEAEVPGLKKVMGMTDLADITEAAQMTPAVHIIYDGDVIQGGKTAGNGAAQYVDQRWLVIVAVRNHKKQTERSETRADGGLILMEVLQALTGWKASADFGPLKRVTAPKASYNGPFAYFPLAFVTRVSYQGTNLD